ncbi:SNF2-related protein [Flavobacterium sp. JP2137]|uniref:DEAD/DEAH box helicase n=1 Tax=Flavobacterium sp. JP2137 TaxID=3414510 RepID=UPI003D300073
MNLESFDSYVKNNSTVISRDRARFLETELISHTKDYFEFGCKGSYENRYIVGIELVREKIANVSCNCPFEYNGLCKHIIAVIRDLKSGLANKDILRVDGKAGADKAGSNKNILSLPKGMMNWEAIAKVATPGDSYYTVKIMAISDLEISTQVSSWQSHRQQFSYDPKTALLHTECSCSLANKLCEHRINALKKIIRVFGADYFSKNYLERKIAEHLAPFNLTLNDDYQSIFQYEMTLEGLKVSSKFKNIKSAVAASESLYADEATALQAQIPFRSSEVTERGLGFCFIARKKEFEALIPVTGKMNKARTDISSSFEKIDALDIDQIWLNFPQEKTQNLLIKTLQLNRLIQEYFFDSDLAVLGRVIALQKTIIPDLKEAYLYASDSRRTLVRKHLEPLSLEEKPVKLFFKLTESDWFYNLKAMIEVEDKKYNITATKVILSPTWVKIENKLYPIDSADLSLTLQHYAENGEANYFKKDWDQVYKNIIQPLSKRYEIQTTILKREKTPVEAAYLERQVYITDVGGQYIAFKPVVKYGEQLIPIYSPELLWNAADSSKLSYRERDQAFEDNFREDFTALHPAFADQEGPYYLEPEQLFENYWMLHAIDRMKQQGAAVFGANQLASFKFNIHKPAISISLKSDIDWFDMEIKITFGDQQVDLKELQKAFVKNSNYVVLGDGTLGVLPEEWMKKFAIYFKAGELKKNSIQLSNFQFGIIDELYEEMHTKPAFLEELYRKKQRLQHIESIESIAVPKTIKATLRDYQQHGLNWLAFLDKNQIGGCLADDMGLGKTLQTIAFLEYLKRKDKNTLPSLIIAPTSLVFNWNSEIAKFCPSLKALNFTGTNRMEHRADFDKYDLVISTYGSLLNDVASLKDFKFNYIILDESQAIKNPNSKRYKAVRLLHSNNRLVLTGTPIENNTFDLYAQLNFLNPGLLGNMNHFRNQFSDHIDKDKNVETAQLLNKIISPFILRRTKEQVAKELPDKTESVIFCEMGKEQRQVYDSFKNKYRDYLLNKIDENGIEKSQMYVLEGLTKLRQICNSTALINSEEDYGNYSAKLEILIENIKEKTGKHKILVFSQFVKMLQIVKTRLEEEQITYEYLDGQTRNRQENVENFQNNEDVRVFLISLKAGGTGLNLTEADYVFIVDPWWNPAVENQAIDRCYRIGQTKNVMAYRMICKDTIEEKIVTLQRKKTRVASSIISIDDEKKSFDVNEIRELFR